MMRIGILGGGAWGTTLAAVARRAGRDVVLWAREEQVVAAVNERHVNDLFLPGIPLDPAIRATSDTGAATDADAVIVAVPAQFVRTVCGAAKIGWPRGVPAILCAKGVEHGTVRLMSEVLAEVLPQAPAAVLSGPTFAPEVARDLPTALTLACADGDLGGRLVDALATPRFRLYSSDDVIGAQVGGAVKNVLAIACGIVEGRGLGENARAAMITRGLAEIIRLGVAKGARPETLMGLSGAGDLILTCSSLQSRNFSLGAALGRGETLEAILAGRRSVAEGVASSASVTTLAATLGIEMPICAAVDAVLNRGGAIDEAIAGLLARPFRAEGPLAAPGEGG